MCETGHNKIFVEQKIAWELRHPDTLKILLKKF